ncbi:MAG: peroxiredoxin family protein [Deltaproteobacteria bacterium]|nr:peroxiredoxin family protein [Deltaproteobacteria bacterium]
MPIGALRETPPEDIGKAKKLGDQVQFFALPNQDGLAWNLQEKLAKGPVVLIFYRGDRCPYCRTQLAELDTFKDELQKRHAQVAAIAPDGIERYKVLHEELALHFDLLHDENALLITNFGLYDDDTSTAWPDVYILQQHGATVNVAWVSLAETYKIREQPALILAALDALKNEE